jgi:hypothetical protein
MWMCDDKVLFACGQQLTIFLASFTLRVAYCCPLSGMPGELRWSSLPLFVMLEPRKRKYVDDTNYHQTYKHLIDRHETCGHDRSWVFILVNGMVFNVPECFEEFYCGAEILQCVKDIGWFPVDSACANSDAILAVEDQMNGPVFWKG